MKQKEYNQLAEKTLSYNFYAENQKEKNLLHCAMGLVTEASELVENYNGVKKHDSVNVFEECGDIVWYCSIPQRELGFEIPDSFFTTPIEEEIFIEYGTIYCLDLINASSNLLDYHKKMLFYGKPLEESKYKELFFEVAKALNVIVQLEGFNIEDIHERNISKLKARYGEKFTSEGALNRNLEKERVVLEK
jgi:NTP pyrophosphatase (non-canonical NTP hydrolase)